MLQTRRGSHKLIKFHEMFHKDAPDYLILQSDIIWDIIPKLNRGRQKRILIIKSPTVKIDCVVKSPGGIHQNIVLNVF
jgi:hypothetical protein